MTTLKKLPLVLFLSVLGLILTISVYGLGVNPFASKLDSSTVKSLDNIVDLIKSKGSKLSLDGYDNLVLTIDNRLEYLSHEMKEIRSNLNVGNNTSGNGINCAVEQPPIFPFHNEPVALNKSKIVCAGCDPNDPGYMKNGIRYRDGWEGALDGAIINNKTIFGQVAEFDIFHNRHGWPSISDSSYNIKNNEFLSLKFNTDTVDAFSVGGDFGLIGTQIGNSRFGHIAAANGGGRTIAISECPGDFSTHLNQDSCINEGGGQLKYSTYSQANVPFVNSPNPEMRDWFCLLEEGKTYYLNIINSKTPEDGYTTSTCSSGNTSCGILSYQTPSLSDAGVNLIPVHPRNVGPLSALPAGSTSNIGPDKNSIGRQWSSSEKDTINSKTISWPANNLKASIKAFKYIALEFNSGNSKKGGTLDIFGDTYTHPHGYKIAPSSYMSISTTPGDFTGGGTRTCRGFYANGSLSWAVGYTKDGLKQTWNTCLLDKNTTYYLNIRQGGSSNKYTNCESSSGECGITIKNDTNFFNTYIKK